MWLDFAFSIIEKGSILDNVVSIIEMLIILDNAVSVIEMVAILDHVLSIIEIAAILDNVLSIIEMAAILDNTLSVIEISHNRDLHVGTQLLKIEKKADSSFVFGICPFFMKDIKEGTSTGTRDFLVETYQNCILQGSLKKVPYSLQ